MATEQTTSNRKIKKLNQHIGTLVASLGGFALGVSLGWCSSVTEGMRIRFIGTIMDLGLVGSILNVGACVGVVFAVWAFKFHHWIGALIKITFYVIGWSMIALARENITMLITGRFMCGIPGGMSCLLVPLFIGDIADHRTRNRLLILFQLLINCGVMYAYLMAHVLNGRDMILRYSSICGLLSCLLLLLLRFIPASPFYHLLATVEGETKAKNSLRWYRDEEYKIDDEMEELRQLAILKRTTKITSSLMMNREVLRAFLMCFGVIMIQQFSGYGMFTTYALTIFETQGSGCLQATQLTLVIGVVQILANLLAYSLIDVLGRRILLTISSAFMGLFLALLGWFFGKRDENPEYEDWYWWMLPAWVGLFFGALNLGVAPMSWALLADSFPQKIRLFGAAFGALANWILSIIAMIVVGTMCATENMDNAIWLFAIFCWLGAIFCALVVKDNGKKSFMEIEESFRIGESSRRNEELAVG